MLYMALMFLIVALVAGVLGITGSQAYRPKSRGFCSLSV